MHTYSSRYFGEIDLEKAEEWYESEIEYKGRIVSIDLYIDKPKQTDAATFELVDNFLNNLSEYEISISLALKKDLKEKGFTHSYIQIVKDEIETDEMDELLLNVDKKLKKQDQILSAIYLSRIGLYADKEDETLAIFDYTISEDLTDELLVVSISKDKQIKKIIVES
ncbi:DUF2004 domain-containing protein [Rhodocytophaga rosea]|uniref:DUF2004 domain-containing protein n=1 Tax=Rhodocytophaga rosea TaxID=2704465 RepID=A0A6C0GN64_9BACT|nr:DUF2004 domain-containing protein [Rhodocytophaga rosea]QHT69284.1 DUF2004 domain-containing protein [Rhodocytophaga rosea]